MELSSEAKLASFTSSVNEVIVTVFSCAAGCRIADKAITEMRDLIVRFIFRSFGYNDSF